ncbi:MAG TPA: hypothetical protein VHX14_14750 [Thermoanaerobaculia bacterium]|jgi:hypothetical protein|nr:hypothetical protein [Thermoanaerobaculia bacterium]
MTTFDAGRLMNLLPAVYRNRDADRGELRALLTVVAREIAVVQEDLAQLYDDQFIETCAGWVIPYIGDLLGTSPLYNGGASAGDRLTVLFPDLTGPQFVPHAALRARPDVAKTIFYRKRTATLTMLEELAADVTGWGAHVVEMFQHMIWSQWIRNHLRLFSHECPDIRQDEFVERIDGPFDTSSHTADVRAINQFNGRYEVRNIAFFLWRLRAYPLERVDARAAASPADYRFFANRAGFEEPLFTRAQRSADRGSTESEIPGPIRQALFRRDLQTKQRAPGPPPATDFYGDSDLLPDLDRSLAIYLDGVLVIPELICACDLTNWRRPVGFIVATDVRTGRIALGDGYTTSPAVSVSYHYGFPGDIGGGSYSRSSWMIKPQDETVYLVDKHNASMDTIKKARDQWVLDGRPNAIIRLTDNRTYVEPAKLVLDPPSGGRVAIEAADGANPHIIPSFPIEVTCADDATVTLAGLLIEGSITVKKRKGTLRLLHTTVIPAFVAPIVPSIKVTAPASPVDTFRLQIAFSITGPLYLSPGSRGVTIDDSIIDGGNGFAIAANASGGVGPSLSIERSTVFGGAAGAVSVRELPLASETIFTGALLVERRQEGCARFSFLPEGSRTPRRYRCQPDLEIATRIEAASALRPRQPLSATERQTIGDAVRAFLLPSFTSIHYPDPGYAQLHRSIARQIFTGAEDFSEMGVYCHLKQPQRETNLRTRIEEHLPFGMRAGLIYVT